MRDCRVVDSLGGVRTSYRPRKGRWWKGCDGVVSHGIQMERRYSFPNIKCINVHLYAFEEHNETDTISIMSFLLYRAIQALGRIEH